MATFSPLLPLPRANTSNKRSAAPAQPLAASGLVAALQRVSRLPGPSSAARSVLVRAEHDGAPLEELSWSGHRVVWSKGGAIEKCWSFPQLGQLGAGQPGRSTSGQVTQALFAYFPASTTTLPPRSSDNRAGLSTPEGDAPTFSPFQPPSPPAWTDDPLPTPIHPTPSYPSSAEPAKLERHLVVLLRDTAFIYPPSGGSIPVHLPFHIKQAWALDQGLLLERELGAGSDLGVGLAAREEPTPTLYTLLHPMEEIRPVAIPPPSLPLSLVPNLAQSAPFTDGAERVIFTSSKHNEEPPIVVTTNTQRGKISVWSYRRIAQDLGRKDPKGKGKERASSRPPATASSRPPATASSPVLSRHLDRSTLGTSAPPANSNKRKRPSFAGPSGSTSHPPGHISLGDRDRSISTSRRISLSHNGAGVGSTSMTGEADLLEALGVGASSAATAMQRATSAMSSASMGVDRRTSVTRNELSVTMDRMALGVGSRDGHPLGLGGDMDREATMLFGPHGGQHEDELRSDVDLRKVWEMDLAGSGDDVLAGLAAFVFDTRRSTAASASQETTSTLALHIPASSTLLLLAVTSTSSPSPADEVFHMTLTPLHQLSASHCCPALVTRTSVLDLIFMSPSSPATPSQWGIVTAAGAHEPFLPPLLPHGRQILSIEGDGSSTVALLLDDGSRYTTVLQRHSDTLAGRCLQVLSHVLGSEEFLNLRQTVDEGGRRGGDWQSFELAVSGLFGVVPDVDLGESAWRTLQGMRERSDPMLARVRSSRPVHAPPSPPLPRELIEATSSRLAILQALHLLSQDLKLRTSTQVGFVRLGKLLLTLSQCLGAKGWVDYWARSLGESVAQGADLHADVPRIPTLPPDLMRGLQSLLVSQSPFSTISNCFSLDLIASSSSPSRYYGAADPLKLSTQVLRVYSLLAPPSSSSSPTSTSRSRAQSAVLQMHQLGWTTASLKELSVGVGLVCWEAVRMCQFDPAETWSGGVYNLVRRSDLARQFVVERSRAWTPSKRKSGPPGKGLSINDIVTRGQKGQPLDRSISTRTEQEEMATGPKAERFNEDRRLEEVLRMLQFSEPVTIASDMALDQLTPNVQQNLLGSLSSRTLALPIGYGMFTYRTVRTKVAAAESVPIPRINTAARILPMPSSVAYIEKEHSTSGVTQDRLEWPEFHAGVAAALQLQASSSSFDSSQISFNKPTDLDAKHAGFLMGLGLIGQISSMAFNQAFEYLKTKHDPTSIGLLLGLAVNYIGTGDPKVTSLISVHLAALHPPHSAPLNVSGITQSAGLIGMGLLYLGTQRRTLADVMIRELCAIKVIAIEDPLACREAYALSAGFAFGMIMLGSGNNAASTPGEVDLLRTFRALILGESNHPLPGAPPSRNITDVNITSSAATIALALMYLRTERQDVADMLEIPDTVRRLDYVRSDLLLLRTLTRSIIMWDDIRTSKAWVESHLPRFIVEAEARSSALNADLEIARSNIIAGACLAMGLKFAGTATAEAHGTLIYFMDRLTRAAYNKAPHVQGKIRRDAHRCCLSVVANALAMVMAGTGELNVLRRLRVAHGHFGEGVTYGTHLAAHMSLGLLVVGQGRHTLGTSNSAVAALLLAFYPLYPSSPVENRGHLQAYRHLWTLAVEPRCLEARDVDTNEPTFLPVRLRLTEKGSTELRAKQLIAPTLIPELRLINTIQVDTPRYWGYSLHLTTNPAHLTSLIQEGVLYVKRRTGHLSYAQDTRGIRSIFTKSKSETGSSVIDFGEAARILSPSAAGLQEFVSYFSDDIEAKAAVACLTRLAGRGEATSAPPSPFEAFCASVLLECLTRDKRDTVNVYLSIYQAYLVFSSPNSSSLSLLALEQLQFILDFYRSAGAFAVVFAKSSSSKTSSGAREALLQPAFLDHVSATIRERTHSIVEADPRVIEAIETYISTARWPSETDIASRLAVYLAEAGAPDLTSLEQLRDLVLAARRGAENSGVSPEDMRASLSLLMRGTRRAIEGAGKRPWSSEFDDAVVGVWSQM